MVYQNGGLYYPRGVYRRRSDGAYVAVFSAQINLSQYYRLELLVDTSGTDPYYEFWVDGVSQGSATDTTIGSIYEPDRLVVGVFALSWDTNNYTNLDADGIGSGAAEASSRLAAVSTLEAMASQRLSSKSQLEKGDLARLATQMTLEQGALVRWAGKAALQAAGAQRLAAGLTLLKVAQARLAGGVLFEGGAEEWPAPSLRSLGLRLIRLVEVGFRRIGDRQEDWEP